MELVEHSPLKPYIKHAHGRITLSEMVRGKQQQEMNEGSGGRGEIPPKGFKCDRERYGGGFIMRGACRRRERLRAGWPSR